VEESDCENMILGCGWVDAAVGTLLVFKPFLHAITFRWPMVAWQIRLLTSARFKSRQLVFVSLVFPLNFAIFFEPDQTL